MAGDARSSSDYTRRGGILDLEEILWIAHPERYSMGERCDGSWFGAGQGSVVNGGESQRPSEGPEYTGFALAATFGLASVLFWISPDYLGISGWLRYLLYAFGCACMALSLYGALSELGKLLELEALGAFGAGLMFLIPAILLHVGAARAEMGSTGISALKVAALLFDLLGGFLTLFGLADVLEAVARRRKRPADERSRKGGTWLTILSFVSATLPIAAFLVNALTDLLR